MSFKNILRDPNPDPASGNPGGAADPGAPGSPAGGDGGSPAAPAWKSDFDSIRGEVSGVANQLKAFLGEYQGFQSRLRGSDEKKPDNDSEPDISKFDMTKQESVLSYLDARSKHIARKEHAQLLTEREMQSTEQNKQSDWRKNVQAHFGRVNAAKDRYPNYAATVAKAAMTLPNEIGAEVYASPYSEDLEFHLSENPAALFNLVDAFRNGKGERALGKLEARFEAEAEARKASEKKRKFGDTFDIRSSDSGTGAENDEDAEIARSTFNKKSKNRS